VSEEFSHKPKIEIDLNPSQEALVNREVFKVLALMPPNSVSREDLFGYAYLGLVEAASRFDPNRGVPFDAFATFRIRGAIYDGLKKMGTYGKGYQRLKRQILADELNDESALNPKLKSFPGLLSPVRETTEEKPNQELNEAEKMALCQLTYRKIKELAIMCVTDHLLPKQTNPEEETIDQEEKSLMKEAFEQMDEESRVLLTAVYDLDEIGDNAASLAGREGVHRSTITRRHRNVLEKLKQSYDQVQTQRKGTQPPS
jgi:RNA polymerase sigma factor for flagellar operon FliA